MSSCYLLDSPADELDAIYGRYHDVARLSKHAGGIGLAFHRVRSRGSLIKGTNGLSNGIVPWLKTLDASVAAVNQGGKRKGAACVYLETWHADIEEFLELRDSTGDEARRVRNINFANWVPDLFMSRVENDWVWSLFDPKKVPHLMRPLRRRLRGGLHRGRTKGHLRAPGTGPPALRPHDAHPGLDRLRVDDVQGPSNERCNQTGLPGRAVHLSNLCTEIIEVTDNEHTAVCNLGSVNLGCHGQRRQGGLRASWGSRAHRGEVLGPGHRHQLLPDRACGPLQSSTGAPSAWGSWASRTFSSSWACLSTAPRRGPSLPG